MALDKTAKPDYQIMSVFKARWSPYAFADKPVSKDDLRSVFEAARWAASSYNEQPWRYIVGTKDNPELYEKVLSCLLEGNQAWAKAAPVLGIGCIRENFTQNEKPNRVALHDLGAASAQLTAEATARDLVVHQMAGIDQEKAREVFDIPEGFKAETGIAIGYVGDSEQLDDPFKKRDLAERTRRPHAQFIFAGEWGKPAPWVESK